MSVGDKKITIFGIFPPPLGGVSVHLRRITEKLVKDDFKVTKIDTKTKANAFFKLLKSQDKIVHFHLPGIYTKYLIALYCILFHRKIVIQTIHGRSVGLFKKRPMLMKWALNGVDYIICTRKGDRDKLINYGVNKPKITEIPAYIKPIPSKNEYNNLPEYIKNILERKNCKIIVSSGAVRLYHGKDLYGIKKCIMLTKRLIDNNINVYFIFALLNMGGCNSDELGLYKKTLNLIEKLKLENNFILYEPQDQEFYPLLLKGNFFLRATITDGDSLSVREALSFDTVCLASNNSPRPAGTTLFTLEDDEDLIAKSMDIFNGKIKKKNSEKYDFYEEMREIYLSCID